MTSHLLDIVTISSQRNTSINGIKEYENNGMLDYNVTIKVESKEKLELFIEDLKHANFVVEVKQ
jgi:(p)ppGpp synthase/HD superfamily hydrolase